MIRERAQTPQVLFGREYKKGEFLPFYVPRELMPQIPESDLAHTIQEACLDLLVVQFDCVDPRTLVPHQRVNREIVKNMPPLIQHKVILVSQDNYILDGNHRWWANVEANSPYINIIRFGMVFDSAIDWLLKLPWTYEVDVNGKMVRRGHQEQINAQ